MKIVAMVRFNRDWAYVFDEPVSLNYHEETIGGTRYLIGKCGPFFNFLKYERAQGEFKAFAGRIITLRMDDGTLRTIKDDWWSTGSPKENLTQITYSDVASLKKCYVYSGGYADSTILQEMVKEYDTRTKKPYGHPAGGFRYDYYDYQKIIRYDDLRRKAFQDQRHLERAKRHLIAHVKDWASKAREKPRYRVPAISVRSA